jgi:hypothetical protein
LATQQEVEHLRADAARLEEWARELSMLCSKAEKVRAEAKCLRRNIRRRGTTQTTSMESGPTFRVLCRSRLVEYKIPSQR